MKGRRLTPRGAKLARVGQLCGKTNQFNPMTRRYDEATIRGFAEREDVLVRGFSLADRFGDHGLVSAVIGLIEGDALRIDEWVMSCRVFSRTAEQFIMNRLLDEARARGLARIVGEYRATEKNGVVAALYPGLGFAPTGENRWTLELAAETARETFITCRGGGQK